MTKEELTKLRDEAFVAAVKAKDIYSIKTIMLHRRSADELPYYGPAVNAAFELLRNDKSKEAYNTVYRVLDLLDLWMLHSYMNRMRENSEDVTSPDSPYLIATFFQTVKAAFIEGSYTVKEIVETIGKMGFTEPPSGATINAHIEHNKIVERANKWEEVINTKPATETIDLLRTETRGMGYNGDVFLANITDEWNKSITTGTMQLILTFKEVTKNFTYADCLKVYKEVYEASEDKFDMFGMTEAAAKVLAGRGRDT